MGRKFAQLARQLGAHILVSTIAVAAFAIVASDCRGEEEPLPPQTIANSMPDIRYGGTLEESYNYHHLQPMRSAIERGGIPQANGWYNYGFPMKSYRYGWFGAERSYPRVSWRDTYYGDCRRTSYRRGY